ncbi:MAG: prephenate dehydratase [Thermoanaerobaculia bacterium]|nr:prephenate dehydratase [Thermoanaerobaculia bacterium]
MTTRIAHLGPRATNTEAAAIRYDPDAELLPVASVAAAVAAVEGGEADLAMVAAENAIDGAVRETLDQLLRPDLELAIRGELVLPIRHVLVGAPGIDPAAAERVYSHPQALAQCREHLRRLAPNAEHVASLSTTAGIAAAIEEVGSLGVGPPIAAEDCGGEIYADDISDIPQNVTRFLVLGAEDHAPTGDDKTSLAFTTEADRAGSLVEVLQLFSSRAVNMTHIESRPTREQLGTYVFLVDIQGHRADTGIAEALEAARAVTSWFRVLGSSPRWTAEA